jgi:opacity protein-like surface antigen
MRRGPWWTIPILLAASGPAQAESDGSSSGMAGFLSDRVMDIEGVPGRAEARFELGWGVAGALDDGWELPAVSPGPEAEGADRRSTIRDVKVDGERLGTGHGNFWATSGMVNGALDITAVPVVTPYVMAGLGLAVVAGDDTGSDRVLAYQTGAGLGYAIGPATLFVGYRYFATSQPDLAGTKLDLESHNIEVGVRYGF